MSNDSTSLQSLREEATQYLTAIRYCLTSRWAGSALVLLYSLIDLIASLNRPAYQTEGQRQDFVSWVDTYMQPLARLGCNGIDLYAARCSTVHAMSAASSLSRQGKARVIFYCFGDHPRDLLQTLIARSAHPSAIAMQVEDLIAAVDQGISCFLADLEKDQSRQQRVRSRLKEVLITWRMPEDLR